MPPIARCIRWLHPPAPSSNATNPCGLAAATTAGGCFSRALTADPLAAFGSVLGLNRPLGAATAERILAAELFVECIIAPEFTAQAQELARQDRPAPWWPRRRAAPYQFPAAPDRRRPAPGPIPSVNDPADWTVVKPRPLAPG